eukprot:1552182-Rhodomonas_salina.2
MLAPHAISLPDIAYASAISVPGAAFYIAVLSTLSLYLASRIQQYLVVPHYAVKSTGHRVEAG